MGVKGLKKIVQIFSFLLSFLQDFESVIVSSGDYSQVNIAMSEAPLHLHMDLPYYSLPPGLQILHCLR